MICLTVGFGGSGGPSSAAVDGPPFFFLSVVKISKSSSGGAAFFPADAFFAGAFVAVVFAVEAGAALLSFPFFTMFTQRQPRSKNDFARFHGSLTLSP